LALFFIQFREKQIAMKKIILFSILSVITMSSLQAQDAGYKTALGVRLSSSNAMVSNSVSLKHFVSSKMAIEGLLSFGDPLAIGALVEIHNPLSATGLSWYYGAGGYIGFLKTENPNTQKTNTDANFGAQGIIGLDYKFSNIPLNISLDWKPELNIVSTINFEPAAIGFTARFTFGK
jgi:hypothetical protein